MEVGGCVESAEKLMFITTAPPIGFGLSIKALPLQGINPAGREDQLNRADCREGLLVFEAANGLEKGFLQMANHYTCIFDAV